MVWIETFSHPFKSSRPLPLDRLWEHLIQDLQLPGNGEPFWFGGDAERLINHWLDELVTLDPQQWKVLQVCAFSL